MACSECGYATRDRGEFHPYVFCVLVRAGRDPWVDLRGVTEMLGYELPSRPPPVRELPLTADPRPRIDSKEER